MPAELSHPRLERGDQRAALLGRHRRLAASALRADRQDVDRELRPARERAQLLQLPGFGQVKVKRIKDAFEKPFRGNPSSILPFSSQRLSQPDEASSSTAAGSSKQDKGKQHSDTSDVGANSKTRVRLPREPSPVWDIELDLSSPARSPSPRPAASTASTSVVPSAPRSQITRSERPLNLQKRSPSPIWDIELDLNESDLEEAVDAENGRKHCKGGYAEDNYADEDEDDDGFGAADLLQ